MAKKLDASGKNAANLKVAETDDDWDDLLGGGGESDDDQDDNQADDQDAEDDNEAAESETRKPTRVRLLKDVDGGSADTCFKAGAEYAVSVDGDGDVWIMLDDDTDGFMLEPDEWEAIAWEGDEEPAEAGEPQAVEGNGDGVQSHKVASVSAEPVVKGRTVGEIWPEAAAKAAQEGKLRNAQDWLLKATLHRRNCEVQLERAKSALKDAEEEENAAADRVEKIMAEPDQRELFDKAAPEEGEESEEQGAGSQEPDEPATVAAGESSAKHEAQGTAEPGDTSWREVLVKDLPLPMTNALVGVLAANPDFPIHTMGDLSDWTAQKYAEGCESPLTAIPKIGKGKAEKILEAHDKFWATWANRKKS